MIQFILLAMAAAETVAPKPAPTLPAELEARILRTQRNIGMTHEVLQQLESELRNSTEEAKKFCQPAKFHELDVKCIASPQPAQAAPKN